MNLITALCDKLRPPRAVIQLPPMIEIESAIFPMVVIPFNGEHIPFIIKELNDVEVRSCGNFSLIEDFSNRADSLNPTVTEMVEYSEIQHKICKISMISPSYDDVMSLYDKTETIKSAKEKLKEIEIELIKLELEGKSKKYIELRSQHASCLILANLILPNDFTAFVTSYALELGKSDIKKVSYDILLEAAILAENGHDSPHNHLSGKFSDFNKKDIDNRAWHILYKEREKTNHGS